MDLGEGRCGCGAATLAEYVLTRGASATRMFHAVAEFWVTSVNPRHAEKRTARSHWSAALQFANIMKS